MVKVGIVSANWGAFAHLPAWRALPDVEVVGICTSRLETAEKAAAQFGISRPFWSVEAMAADPEIDIIDVGTRPVLRDQMVLDCFKHRKHVYAGIPQASGFEGARAMHRAWGDSGSVAIVDAYAQWLPAHQQAKEMIDAGYLGRPLGGTCTFSMSLFNQLKPEFPYNWFSQGGQGVSAGRNLGSHALHTLVSLFGNVAEVVALERRLLEEWRSADGQTVLAPENTDFADALLRFENGMTLQLQVSWNTPVGPGWQLDVFGTAGRMLVQGGQFPTPRGTTLQAGKVGETALSPVEIAPRFFADPRIAIDADAPMPPAYPMALAMQSMIDEIEGRGKARPGFDQAWQVECVLEAIRRSTAERRWVAIDELG